MRNIKITSYIEVSIILLFVYIFSFIYLSSPNNLTGMTSTDGYTHSILAEQIYEKGIIIYEYPHRIFQGKALDSNGTTYQPVSYFPFYHLSLGTYNALSGSSIFSYNYTIIINVLVALFIYLIFRKYIVLRILLPILTLLLTAQRSLFINFMEPLILLYFLIFIFLIKKYFSSSKNVYFYMSIFFLCIMIIIKQTGAFVGIMLLIAIIVLDHANLNIKKIFFIGVIFALMVIIPYLHLLINVGSVGYGVGTQQIPSFIPFHNFISDTFLHSKYQKHDWDVWEPLSYQQGVSIIDNLKKISNYLVSYPYAGDTINYFVLSLIGLSIIILLIFDFNMGTITIIAFLSDLFLLIYKQFQLHQYSIILNFLIILLTVLPIVFFYNYTRSRYLKIGTAFIAVMLLFVVFTSFFLVQHSKLYSNTGRTSINMEKLYIELGAYINKNNSLNGSVFLASDPQFGFNTGQNYVWYPDFFDVRQNMTFHYQFLKDYYHCNYIIIASYNLYKRGLYDDISEEGIDRYVESGKLYLLKRFQIEDDFIDLYLLK